MLQRDVSNTIHTLYSNLTKIKIRSSIMKIIAFSNLLYVMVMHHLLHVKYDEINYKTSEYQFSERISQKNDIKYLPNYFGIFVQTKMKCGYYIKHRLATSYYT